MKVIELLLQGKKVWDINKNGYFYKITPVGFSPTGDFYL